VAFKRKFPYALRLEDAPDWLKQELKHKRLHNALWVIANAMVAGVPLTDEVFAAAGGVFRPDDGIPEAKMKIMMRQPLVQASLNEKVQQALAQKGVEVEDVVEGYKEAYAMAQDTYNPKVMIEANDRLSVLMGVTDARGNLQNQPRLTPHREGESFADADFEDITGEEDPLALEANRARREEREDTDEDTETED